jgi:hypothetical protein
MAASDAPGPRPATPGTGELHGAHEKKDVNIRGAALFGVGLTAVLVIVLGSMVWLFDWFARREAGRQGEPTTLMMRPAVQLPPEPRLQENPAKDLADYRAEEEALLNGYGWVDRKAGQVRIPVRKAMEIVVRKGLK